MFSLLKKYELRGAKRRVRLFNRFRIESVLKIAPYHTLIFGCIGKLAYLCTVVQRKAIINHKFKAFALTGRQGFAHNNPGRCPGLGASALSGRVEAKLAHNSVWFRLAPRQVNIQHSTLKLKIMEVKGTLKYRKVQRTPQTGENAGKKKWYATSVTDREVDFEGFVSHISDHGSPYSRGTIHGVLMDALDHLQELILDGKSVRLSDLGLFSIGMSSKAEDTKEKVTAASVEGVHLIVRNTKSWSNAELRKKCKIQEYGGYIGTDEEGTTGGGDTDTSQGGSGTTGGGTQEGGGGGSQDSGDGLE